MAVKTVDKINFKTEVLESDKPVLVDFWAAWCGPCKMIGPIVDEVAKEVEKIKVCKVNVDENQELAVEYGVMSIPTLILFKNGKVKDKSIGVVSKAEILKLIEQ